MDRIRICSLMDAINMLSFDKHYDVISIRDSGFSGSSFFGDPPWQNNNRLLALYYDDILESEQHDYHGMGLVAPNRGHVEQVRDFFLANREGHYLIHCFAGRSRSSAVAFYVAFLISGDPAEALCVLNEKHDPNLTFIRYAAEVEGVPELYDMIVEREKRLRASTTDTSDWQ